MKLLEKVGHQYKKIYLGYRVARGSDYSLTIYKQLHKVLAVYIKQFSIRTDIATATDLLIT